MTTGPVPAPPPEPARPEGAARTALHVRRTLEQALRSLEEAAARTRLGADDEAVHDLRVASRRLTARLDFWRALLRRRRTRRARRRLRSLRRRLGPMRELEAAIALLRARLSGLPHATRESLAIVIGSLEARLPASQEAAATAATSRRVERIRSAVERAARDIELRAGEAQDLDDRLAAELATRRETAAGRLAAAMLGGDDPVLHVARIAVKRWRYGLECARDLAGDAKADAGADGGSPGMPAPARATDPRLKHLRRLQEALGLVQDVALLRALLEAEAGRLVSGGHPARAAALHPAFEQLAADRAEAVAAAATILPRLGLARI